jgi:hypothetical protein
VLLIAPRTDLPGVDIDVEDVLTSGLDVDPLLGEVRPQDVTRRLRKGGYDAAIFAGHGVAGGVQLAGSLLGGDTLAAAARCGRLAVLVLNTCESAEAGQVIANDSQADVICTVGLLDDGAAAHTLSLWSSEYARTGDARTAYEAAKPGNNAKYLYLTGRPGAAPHDDMRHLTALIDRLGQSLGEQIRDVGKQVDRLDRRVGALESKVADVDAKVDAKTDAIVALLPPSSPWRVGAWLVGFGFLLLPPLAFYWLHDAGAIPRDGLVLTVLAGQSVAIPFFAFGSGLVRESRVTL